VKWGLEWMGQRNYFASPSSLPRLKVGDLVHVFEGTGAGLVNGRDVGWFGKFVGMVCRMPLER
jgi:hypothetical protein